MQQHRDAVTDQRWRLPADICAVVRRRPVLTHADLVEELGLEPKVVTEALTRLTRADLLETVQEMPGRKGRPAAKIIPHPRGPVVAAWRSRHRAGGSASRASTVSPSNASNKTTRTPTQPASSRP